MIREMAMFTKLQLSAAKATANYETYGVIIAFNNYDVDYYVRCVKD